LQDHGTTEDDHFLPFVSIVGQHFVIVKTLPISIYYYRFVVDGQWTHAPDFPSDLDDSGYFTIFWICR